MRCFQWPVAANGGSGSARGYLRVPTSNRGAKSSSTGTCKESSTADRSSIFSSSFLTHIKSSAPLLLQLLILHNSPLPVHSLIDPSCPYIQFLFNFELYSHYKPLPLRPSLSTPSQPQFCREASLSVAPTPSSFFAAASPYLLVDTQSPPSLCFSPSASSLSGASSLAVMDLDLDLDPSPPPPGAEMPSFGLAGSSLPETQPGAANAADGFGSLSIDRRPKKSSMTCAVCRFRKVRCNGARPSCGNCQRLGFPCSYDDTDVDAWSLSLPRRRVKQACLSCHSRKARCSGHLPSCERCRVQGIECVYRPSKRVKPSSMTKSPNSPDRESDREGGRDGRSQGEHRYQDDGRNESPALTDQASSASPGPDITEG